MCVSHIYKNQLCVYDVCLRCVVFVSCALPVYSLHSVRVVCVSSPCLARVFIVYNVRPGVYAVCITGVYRVPVVCQTRAFCVCYVYPVCILCVSGVSFVCICEI